MPEWPTAGAALSSGPGVQGGRNRAHRGIYGAGAGAAGSSGRGLSPAARATAARTPTLPLGRARRLFDLVLRLLMWLMRGPITAHAFHFDRPPFSSRNPLYSAFPNAPADPLANLLSHRQLEDSAAATAANESRRPGGSAAADKNGKLMYGTFHVQGHCR